MADTNQPHEDHRDIFDFEPNDMVHDNGRRSVRYVRTDIQVVILINNIFGTQKKIKAQLINIGSKGVSVSTEQKLSINRKLRVALKFRDGKTFIFKAKVVRRVPAQGFDYGIAFETPQNSLGEHLLETQTDLLFK